jgi:hypothetical protein
MPSLRTVGLAFLSVLAAAPGVVTGADASLYLVDTTFSDQRTTINRLDPATGDMRLAADLGSSLSPVLGLAAASNKVLYATGTDTSMSDTCLGLRSCLLLRIELTPDDPSSLPGVTIVGPVRSAEGVITEITGLTFRSDGMLLAASQETDSLYEVDPASGWATLVGELGLDLHGGDTTMDDQGQVWLWSNIGSGSGLYQVDSVTAQASAFQLFPGLSTAGLAAVGHTGIMYAARPSGDQLIGIDPVTGFAVISLPLTLDGQPFDHARGDLDSPFCADDASCDDGNPATGDLCTPGGCRYQRITDVDILCPCEGPGRPWVNHGEYVSCVAAATRTGMDRTDSARNANRRAINGPAERPRGRGEAVSAAARSSCGA